MLAGKMKLRNFVLIALLVVAGGTTAAVMSCHGKDEPKPTVTTQPPPPPAPDAAVAMKAAEPVAVPAKNDLEMRPYDAQVIGWHAKALPGGKGKDVSKGKPYKINIYQDAGKTVVNRAKVDANRNNKFEDKFTFKDDGSISLEHAPADDENYTESYVWNGAGWTRK